MQYRKVDKREEENCKMRDFQLFHDLAQVRGKNYAFWRFAVMSTEAAEHQIMKQAKILEEDGYIKLTECNNHNTLNNAVGVTLAGCFTHKGIQYIEEQKIESSLYK